MDSVRRIGGDSIARFLQRAFICLLVLLTLGLGLNLYALASVRESFRQAAAATIELTTARYRLQLGMTEQSIALQAYLSGDNEQLSTISRLNGTLQDEYRRVDALPGNIVTPDVRLLLDRQRTATARWAREVAEPAIQQRNAGAALPTQVPLPPGSDSALDFRAANQGLDALIAERRARDEANGTALVQSLTALLVAGSLILIIGWAFVLWQVKRRVRRPLAALVAAAESVAAGRRSISVDVPHRDEFAVMATSLESMVAAIRRQEVALASQMRHRDTILEHMAEGLVATEPDGGVVLMNPASVYLLGIEDAENPQEAAAAVLAQLLAYDQ
ncbi:MAG: HAMP domain-containing protein, partial [Chloroflexi bacterium]|nr:HAMP domain-containing protein [Chloroflexota bacterium]